ncbi:MAG: hypothetical protein K0S32_44 [Bacteroidetes bacterium]|jgi:hypothetical protein|nr:hypothetical protein [Bacteroidota bacterium]
MKTVFKLSTIILTAMLFVCASCKKKKNTPEPTNPIPPNESELITTFKLLLTDSATNATTTYMFKDPDGDGGVTPYYGPGTTTTSSQTDSVVNLLANKTYYGQIILLDETKSPVDSISNAVNDEGKHHMFFYNNGMNTILSSSNPYAVQLNGSNIKVTYTDLDAGSTQRGIGLLTKWRTNASTGSVKNKLVITLRHQPDSKDGTFTPGETDIEVSFKIVVN